MLSIIVPTKDEPLVQNLINKLRKEFPRAEILIIDKSKRAPRVHGAKVFKQKSDGLAKAFIEGLQKARGNFIALMDADLSHRPEDLKVLLKHAYKYDITVGSRFLSKGEYNTSLQRKIVTKVANCYARLLTGLKLTDPMSGFMVAKRDALNTLLLKGIGYKIVLEICYKASKAGYKICEVPIKFTERRAGKTKVGFNLNGVREVLNIIWLTFKLVTRYTRTK